ncbi:MAG: hydroxymethylbilane synthase [Deltaproteobacteria bacterium]|nr:MAG: hydroxymethylbilane synthase [Deltaproteobacteria bacterium]
MHIRIGTRASQLALAQALWVRNRISDRYPDTKVEIVKIKTRGDRIIDRPLSSIGGKGLFVKEIEEALQREDIDVAVHSLKDVPAEIPNNLHIGIFPEREDSHDVIISRNNIVLDHLPQHSSIGTSSLRRTAQLLHYRPDLNVIPLRGNLDTRLRKLHTEDLQAIVVAAAGLRRVGLSERITQSLPIGIMVPAIGQGALGLELRRDDHKVKSFLAFLDHYPTRIAIEAERSFLRELRGGCELPVGAHAMLDDKVVHLDALVASPDGKRVFRNSLEGTADEAGLIGARLAKMLLGSGAQQIIDDIHRVT